MSWFKQIVDEFLFHCRYEKNLTQATLKAYSIDLEQFKIFLEGYGCSNIGDVDKHVIRAYLGPLASRFQPKTTKRKIATLKVFFSYLEFEDTIMVNPFRKMRVNIALEKKVPHVMALAEVEKLFTFVYRCLQRSTTHFQRSKLLRDIAILELLFATGMRVSELCHLKQGDVDLIEGVVRVYGKGRKERIVPICQTEVIDCLQQYRSLLSAHPESPFFLSSKGTPIKDGTIRILVEKHAVGAGLVKKITPHVFRHTLATLLLQSGVDIRNIQQLLGHSSIATTQIYVSVSNQHQRKILATVHPRINFAPKTYPFSSLFSASTKH